VGTSRNPVFNVGERRSHGVVEAAQHRPAGFLNTIGFAEKYHAGKSNIILPLNAEFGRSMDERNVVPAPAVEWSRFHCVNDATILGKDAERWMASDPQGWGKDCALIRIIHFLEIVEFVTTASGEGFLGADGIFHPLTGCFHSIARSFEALPVGPEMELGVAVLCASGHPQHFPVDVIQGGPQIVDSICYYKGDFPWNIFDKSNSNSFEPIRIGMNFKAIGAACDKGIGLPFKIRDMMIGPVDFLFGPFKHT
jgi:hypothetical protein